MTRSSLRATMPGTRRKRSGAAKAEPRPIRLWLHPLLTPTEIRKLKSRAQAEMRSVGNLVTWLIVQDLARPVGMRRRLPGSGGGRKRFGIGIGLTRAEKAALDERLAREMRSVSNYVQVVIVEALR